MIPKRIELENFLSFGSPAVIIEFTDDEPLWVVGGPNGVGKSAVFDAMTYALYGEHRGGAQDHSCLVRHGTNSFRVVFEFEFNGTDYRITRNRPLSGRPTQRVERRADSGWPAVELPSAAGRQDPVKLWAERTLGLGFDAFTASVLLRQGQAEEIITATGARRLAILKKIIGVDRYETLSNRVHAAARRCREQLEDLRTRRDRLIPVTDAELRAARDALTRTSAYRMTAHEQATAAAERVKEAEQWAKLDADRQRLEGQVREAAVRAAAADRIRADMARLNELTAVVPTLGQVVELRCRQSTVLDRLELLGQQAERLRADQVAARAAADQARQKAEAHRLASDSHAREAEQLRDEIGRDQKFIDAADGVKRLREEFKRFPNDLAAQLAAVLARLQTATDAATAAGKDKAEAAGLLKRVRSQREKFATVGVGVTCSLCGRVVTAEHAEQELVRLENEFRELDRKVREAEGRERTAADAKEAAEADRDRIQNHWDHQRAVANRLADMEEMLRELGMTADADDLRRRLSEKTAEVARREQVSQDEAVEYTASAEDAGRLATECRQHEDVLRHVEEGIRGAESERASANGQYTTLTGQLAHDWLARVETLDATGVEILETERQRLARSGVAEQLRQLEHDATLRDEWARGLAAVEAEVAGIPVESRIPVADAASAVQLARQVAADADVARDEAKEVANDLARRADEHRGLTEEIAAAEKQADVHRKLDELLGKDGLQRELVRDAERQIVRLANDTVQNLSDGELTVELDAGADGGDEAFALRVRRSDDPTPIGVSYLSGSQKFRVAVSVALAIGRFAAGQARPLESVIIDEGFGSLDRDGLRAAAEELNRLRQHLRRIVLVSHQEEFADRFPVVIKLTRGENGTTAEAVRR